MDRKLNELQSELITAVMTLPSWVAVGRGTPPGWLRPCLDWLYSTVGSVSSTPAAAPSPPCPHAAPLPTHSLGRTRSPSPPSLAWNHTEEHRTVISRMTEKWARQSGGGLAYLKGASATALVVMAMCSEKSFQVDKKRTETPVWSWRCTTAWWNNGMRDDVKHDGKVLPSTDSHSVLLPLKSP